MSGTTGTTERQATNQDAPTLIAHRGFAGVHPENTVAAFEQAATGLDVRPEMVEVDVMPTADGEVVAFHDFELGRVTDAPADLADRFVWETPYEKLTQLEVLGTGESIPRLADVLDALPPEVGVNVEFKNPGSTGVRPRENLPRDDRPAQRDLWLDFAERVVSTLADCENDVLVSSFAEGALAAVRAVDPSIPVAAVFAESVADGMEVARRYDCEAVHAPWNMISGTPLFNAEYGSLGPYEDVDLVETAHREGRTVNVWTVQSWYQAAQLRRAGVDGVIADYPGVLQFGDDAGLADD
ncbi:glycerophosphodiester phosphodiesterase [Halorussus salilacus]|uniref:glycerophosphodiester phosphodiesterase n=1 Tax=Halorussus salilacus TaxID=2953750 RepID=UPI0020A005DA|nr:glycerophosphodiester phosphodiesterase [Halorussus salilacus]USZ67817.1 glycerophosphodiester phosphodiesterase [Halorussus salilacus]